MLTLDCKLNILGFVNFFQKDSVPASEIYVIYE
mgnify:CR=1 FL=1